MPNYTERNLFQNRLAKLTLFALIVLVLLMVAVSWLMTRGVADEKATVPTADSPSASQLPLENRTEPTNPNVTGGSSGAGNAVSNDPNVGTPSPAGGVDTNQVPAGDSSSPQ